MSAGTTLKKWVVLPLLVAGGLWFGWAMLLARPDVTRSARWQAMARPGPLSRAHAFLASNCAACHTANKGVEAQSCIVCHANNESLLQRQPTAFHAEVRSCVDCHVEHQGTDLRPTQMDHVALARIGLRQVESAPTTHDQRRDALVTWLKQSDAPAFAPQLQREELLLNCATCHQSKDRHVGLFGTDCAQCHTTSKWTIAEYRHPSPVSQSCAQCHQAPPSHYMMHFQMISMKVAGQEHAKVDQCFLCHQTTAWNDIKGVGWYKHH